MSSVENFNPQVRSKPTANGKSPRKASQRQARPAMGLSPNGDGHIGQQLESLLKALSAMAQGYFSVRVETPGGKRSAMGQIARRFNEVVARNEATVREIARRACGAPMRAPACSTGLRCKRKG